MRTLFWSTRKVVEVFYAKAARELGGGSRKPMNLKIAAAWFVKESEGDFSEGQLMLANTQVKDYALAVHGHRWVD